MTSPTQNPSFPYNRIHATGDDTLLWLFALSGGALYLFLFVSLPIGLSAIEEDLNGMSGYAGYFFGRAGLLFIGYGLCMVLLYRFSKPSLRGIVATGLVWLLLSSIYYAYVYPVSYGVLDNYLLSGAGALRLTIVSVLGDGLSLLLALGAALWACKLHTPLVVKGLVLFVAAVLIQAGLNAYSLIGKTAQAANVAPDAKAEAIYRYSDSGKNIVVFMVDGSMSGYLPDIFAKTPALRKTYGGFTWYSNVVSTGNRTINGLPAIFGGFDYTVSGINVRAGESLVEKINQAYALYPDNFPKHGYSVLYSDPFWYGFKRRGDCALFEKLNNGRCVNQIDKVGQQQTATENAAQIDRIHQGLFKQYLALALFRAVPAALKGAVYGDGDWMGWSYSWKRKEDKYLTNYFALETLPEYSSVDASGNTLTVIVNNITRATLVQGKECKPSKSPAITAAEMNRFKDKETVEIFHTMHCAITIIGRYLDWFKENGIYDNTMFVLVSDHGWKSHNPLLEGDPEQTTHAMFQPLLMVKPFGAAGAPVESREFIANASVPGILCEHIGGCIDSHTGKTIRRTRLEEPVLMHSTPWNPEGQKDSQYVIEALYSVNKDIKAPGNWSRLR